MTRVLAQKTVAIAGCGGLGSNAAVALARCGLGRLLIADHDIIEPSNLNRQAYFQKDIGAKKVYTLARYLRAINPDLHIIPYNHTLTRDDCALLFQPADLLIEAFDRAESKRWLIEAWCRAYPSRPIIIGNGIAGYGDSRSVTISRSGSIYFVGDGHSDQSQGLCGARVALVAAMQANLAVQLLMEAPC